MENFILSYFVTMFLICIVVIAVGIFCALVCKNEEAREIGLVFASGVLGLILLAVSTKGAFPIITMPCGILLIIGIVVFYVRKKK